MDEKHSHAKGREIKGEHGFHGDSEILFPGNIVGFVVLRCDHLTLSPDDNGASLSLQKKKRTSKKERRDNIRRSFRTFIFSLLNV